MTGGCYEMTKPALDLGETEMYAAETGGEWMALVTITDGLGSDGAEIAAAVAKALEVPLYDDDGLQRAAEEAGMSAPALVGFDRKAPGLFDRILSRRPQAYLELMESLVYAVARRGEGVIVGHGSQVLLRDFECAFHVRIHSPMGRRLRRVMETRGLQKEAAQRLIRKADSRKEGFFRFAFEKELDALALYDLVLNTAKIGPGAAAELIEASVRNPLVSECTLNALQAMDRMHLVKRVEASLIERGVDLAFVSVEAPDPERVTVTGMVFTEEEETGIAQWTREAAGGAVRVDVQLSQMPPAL
jgi:cytidylate kinase